jgi:hypothetical protein
MNRNAQLAALIGAALLAACGDKVDRTVTGPAPAARIKFFNFGVNAPGVDFYANNVKVTAFSSATGSESTRGSIYGEGGAGGFYVGVTPGQYTLNGKITATTDHGLAISTATQNIENGKAYSFYQSGFYNTTTKTVDAFVIEDAWTTPTDFTKARIRFVNTISNATGPLQLVVKNQATGSTEIAIGAPVAYKSATAFTDIPAGVYDLYGRYTATGANLFTRTGVSLGGLRVITIAARGDITVTGTTATNRPFFDATPNY